MANIELDGGNKKITVDSGDLTLDIPGDIILDADGGDLTFADGGTNLLKITNSSSDVVFQPQVDTKDIVFKQYDGTVVATVEDNATFNIPASKLAIGGTAVTSTASEINLLDGGTSVGSSITLADADGVVVNDGGTMKTIPASDVKTYVGNTWVQTGRVNNSSVGATTINLEGCFSTTYDTYMMILKDFRPATDGSVMRMIILTSTNTAVTGSHYRIANSVDYASGTNSGGVNVERHTGSDEFHFFNSVADGEAHGGGCATLFITVDKSNTSGNTFKYHGTCSFADSNDYQNTGKMGGFYKETTNDENPTGIQFKSDNNITSIDVTMYGLVQS